MLVQVMLLRRKSARTQLQRTDGDYTASIDFYTKAETWRPQQGQSRTGIDKSPSK